MKVWIIYKHTLLVGPHKGWSYIGQTCLANPNQRWRTGEGYKKQRLFYRAIQRYGWENFNHEILEDSIMSLEEANDREKYWISYYHTWINDPECVGYNITPGGDSAEGSKLMTKDDETIKVSPKDFDKYLALGYIFHDSPEFLALKHYNYYWSHKEKQNVITNQYYWDHREKYREINKQNSRKLRQSGTYGRDHQRAWRLANPERAKEIGKRAHEKRKLDPEYKRKHAEANKRWVEKQKLKKQALEDKTK